MYAREQLSVIITVQVIDRYDNNYDNGIIFDVYSAAATI